MQKINMASNSVLSLVLMKNKIQQLKCVMDNKDASPNRLQEMFTMMFNSDFDVIAPRAFEGINDDVIDSIKEDLYLADVFVTVGYNDKAIELIDIVLKKINLHMKGRWLLINRLAKFNVGVVEEHKDIGNLQQLPGSVIMALIPKLAEC